MVEAESHSNPGNSDRKERADTSEQMLVDSEHVSPTSDHCIALEDRNKTQVDNVQIKAANSEVKKHLKHTTTHYCVYNMFIYIYFSAVN